MKEQAQTKRLLWAWFSGLGLVFCITCFAMAAGHVLQLGGYATERNMSWIWIVPVTLLGGLALVFVNLATSKRYPELKTAILAWPGLFLSLGVIILVNGLAPLFDYKPARGGLVVMGVLFVLMGGLPLYLIARNWIRRLRQPPATEEADPERKPVRPLMLVLGVCTVGAGVALGMWVIGLLKAGAVPG